MANRRLLDSSTISSRSRSNSHQNRQFNHLNTLFLSLALASCLISINCASFGRQLTGSSRDNQPEYQILTSQHQQDESVLGNIFGQLSNPFQLDRLKQQKRQLEFANKFGLPNNGRFKSVDSSSVSDDIIGGQKQPTIVELPSGDAQFGYDQPAASRRLIVDQLANDEQGVDSLHLNDYELSSPQIVRESLANANDDNYSYMEKLYKLFGRNSPQSADSQYDLTQLTSKSQPSSLSAATGFDRAQEDSNNIPQFQEASNKDIYQLDQTTSEAPIEKADSKDPESHSVKLTTLVEDEEEEEAKAGQVQRQVDEVKRNIEEANERPTISGDHRTSGINIQPQSSQSSPNYGHLVSEPGSIESQQQQTWSSMFKRMYTSLASYLPSFGTFWSSPSSKSPSSVRELQLETAKEQKTSAAEVARGLGTERDSPSTQSELRSIEGEPMKADNKSSSQAAAKQSVSTPLEVGESNQKKQKSQELNEAQTNEVAKELKTSEKDKNSKTGDNQQQDSYFKPQGDKKSASETDDSDDNLDASGMFEGSKSTLPAEAINFGFPEKADLSLPAFKSASHPDDERLLVRATESDSPMRAESLVGKYIYAPAHHYHLNAGDLIRSSDANNGNKVDEQEIHAQMAHRSYSSSLPGHRFQPGEPVYNSYSARPLFLTSPGSAHGLESYQNGSTLIANKTNDLYFLVMVGSFCAMAMAVVLAAGMFAYRVQQSRKSSSEADYPTYGVVGPNNLCAKGGTGNGGGYFGGSGGIVNLVGAGKCGSVKQLADMYSVGGDSSGFGSTCGSTKAGVSLAKRPANGSSSTITACDQQNQLNSSGNNSGNNSTAPDQNAARMYHYQHQKQQMISSDRGPASGRHTSASDLDSEDENDEAGYTVYECPGLASAHEMEIKNPLFNDDRAP